MEIKAAINKILPYSAVDGPGNRMVIFFQKCNFRCKYCHNPETINLCSNCGTCVDKCPVGALKINNSEVIWNDKLCTSCDQCIISCSQDSSPKVKMVTLEKILKEVEKYQDFISGITVSGGEATLHLDFITQLFKRVKKLNLTTLLDTNGSLAIHELYKIEPFMDYAVVDLKSFDLVEHIDLTKQDNLSVMESIKYLGERNKLYQVRTVIIPDVLDNYYNVDKISQLIASINNNIQYNLIKYRNHSSRINHFLALEPTNEFLYKLKDISIQNGLINVIVT